METEDKKEEVVDSYKEDETPQKNENVEKKDYNDNKPEDNSLEKEVQKARDNKFLADVIIKQEETLSSLRNDMNTILSILKQNSKNFTSSELSNANDNDESKYYFDESKYKKY